MPKTIFPLAPKGWREGLLMTREAPRNGASLAPRNWQPGSTANRAAEFRAESYSAEARTVEVVLSVGAVVERWWGREGLRISAEAVNLDRVKAGQCKFLDTHNQRSIASIVGTLEDAWIEGDRLIGRVKFTDTDLGRLAEGMVSRGELTGVSIGYTVEEWTVSNPETSSEMWTAARWTLLEGSFVSVPADADGSVRSAPEAEPKPQPKPQKETRRMDEDENITANAPVTATTPAAQQNRTSGAAPAPAAPAGLNAADTIALIGRARELGVEDVVSPRLAEPNMTRAVASELILNAYADRQRAATGGTVAAGAAGAVTRDARETEGQAVREYLEARLTGQAPTERARNLVGGMRLIELVALRAGINSRNETEILSRAAHTTSDFPLLLSDAANKALLTAYALAEPTYRRIAARKTFRDFKPHKFLRIGDFPTLQDVNEAGEIKAATIQEGREQASLSTKGILLPLTRQILINDDLGAFADLIRNASFATARTENNLFYALKAQNSGAGPALSDGKAMFHTDHANLAATGAAPSIDTVSAGRAAMRKQTGLDGKTVLNVVPAVMLVGPDRETAAQQLVAPVSPTEAGKWNPFTGAFQVVTDANIVGNAWELYADPAILPNFIYGYLNDASGPMVAQDTPFNMDGVVLKVLHDFAVGAIDYRGGYRNGGGS